jgi:hypothetical protein
MSEGGEDRQILTPLELLCTGCPPLLGPLSDGNHQGELVGRHPGVLEGEGT